jgi:hypothetical protein
MRTLLASIVALGAFTSASLAEPLVLNDAQMDALTAGQDNITLSNTITQINTAVVSTTGNAFVCQSNSASVSQSVSVSGPPPG